MENKATLKDVARVSGFSTATISHVLNGTKFVSKEVKTKINKVIEKLDYVPNNLAKSLKVKKSKLIGLMISDISNTFTSLVVRGVEDSLIKNEYNVLLCNTDENLEKEKKYLKILLGRRVDGLIVSAARKERIHFNNIGVPIVFLNRYPEPVLSEDNFVTTDNIKGACIATEHLINHGYKRIAIIAGPQDINTGQDRLIGYKRALKENGYSINQNFIKIGEFDITSGYEAMKELFKEELKPDAIFTSNNAITLGAYRFLRENKIKVPEEIAFVGYGDPEWASVTEPPFTAIRQPAYNIGLRAANLIDECIRDKTKIEENKIVLEPELIIRKSCGCNKISE